MGFAGAFHPPPDPPVIVGNTGVPSVGMVGWMDRLIQVQGKKKGIRINRIP